MFPRINRENLKKSACLKNFQLLRKNERKGRGGSVRFRVDRTARQWYHDKAIDFYSRKR